MSRIAHTKGGSVKLSDYLRDFPIWLLNDVPEREPKYAHRALLVIAPVALLSFGLFLWLALTQPWWIAFPAGVGALAVGFLAVVRLVSRILPKKFPVERD